VTLALRGSPPPTPISLPARSVPSSSPPSSAPNTTTYLAHSSSSLCLAQLNPNNSIKYPAKKYAKQLDVDFPNSRADVCRPVAMKTR
jgi:hypothetical protein